MILDPISIATKGYVGIGPDAGEYCPTDIAIATFGYVRIEPPEEGGGGQADVALARERRKRETEARERAREFAAKQKAELDALFPETLEQLKETGKAQVGDTEIVATVPPLPVFPPLELIKDDVEREIAELLRAQLLAEAEAKRKRFELGMATFIILAMES